MTKFTEADVARHLEHARQAAARAEQTPHPAPLYRKAPKAPEPQPSDDRARQVLVAWVAVLGLAALGVIFVLAVVR